VCTCGPVVVVEFRRGSERSESRKGKFVDKRLKHVGNGLISGLSRIRMVKMNM
jgi:hypothetical protein